MPRKVHTPEKPRARHPSALVKELAGELKAGRDFGQPLIDEEHFKAGGIRVSVIWDKWDDVAPVDRSSVIVDAYRLAEGEDFANRIGLVEGLTFAEAHASGMLPFQIITALRKGDPVTDDQCRRAMIEEGASILFDPGRPQLRFATEEEADFALRRLVERLPESEPVWVITREVGKVLDMYGNADE